MAESKALIGRKAICDYLGIGKQKFYSLVKDDMPVRMVGGYWTGHKDELNGFFRVQASGKGSKPSK